jgi:hypothetical protein
MSYYIYMLDSFLLFHSLFLKAKQKPVQYNIFLQTHHKWIEGYKR